MRLSKVLSIHQCFPQCSDNNYKKQVLVSLINAWHRSRCLNAPKCENVVSNDTNVSDKIDINFIEGDNASGEQTNKLEFSI